ncbi:hypothetical protein OAF83_03370 [Rubripirellula sp.]|nr:hypothetical protein [Rubripirellula sp.]
MTRAAFPEDRRDRWLAADGGVFAMRETEHLAQLFSRDRNTHAG